MKNLYYSLCLLVAGLIITIQACNQSSSTPITVITDQNDLNWKQLADLLMDRMDLQQGEKVLLVGSFGRFDPLYEYLINNLQESDCEFLGFINSGSNHDNKWSTGFTKELEGMSNSEAIEYIRQVDLGVMLPGAQGNPIYGQLQQNLKENIGRTIHFHWAGAYDFSMNELEVTPEIDQIYQQSLLETDYGQLEMDQQRFADAIRNQSIRVTTPAGTDIAFSVGDRPITRQDGNASQKRQITSRNLIDREIELPAGAIRVAPIEETVNGVIAFPNAKWNGIQVEDLNLTFEKGKIVAMEASTGIEAAQREIANGGNAAKSFREFVLGMNPTLSVVESSSWFPYYGYGAGVVRLSLGNNLELGGNVSGNYVRWNLFADATVIVGNDVWVEDGKLKQKE